MERAFADLRLVRTGAAEPSEASETTGGRTGAAVLLCESSESLTTAFGMDALALGEFHGCANEDWHDECTNDH